MRRGAGELADAVKAGTQDGVEAALGLEVGGDLGIGEHGFKLADEVGGGDDLFAEFAQQLDGAGIDHGHVHDGVARAVLHGDGCGAFEHGGQRMLELLPGAVLGFGALKGVEAGGLDAVDELAGCAVGRYEVVPAARD